MILSLVIPAYNEEKAIASVIRSVLAAREGICKGTGIRRVEVIVVDDGSKDRTFEIVRPFRDSGQILLVAYQTNRGYGAALKRGFRRAQGEIVGFFDADATCDPACFVSLINCLLAANADVCVGSRMGKGSRMPFLRRVGNLFYAGLVSVVSGTKITDLASGIRVLRKASLEKIYPLPDGLDFTPALSTKAALDRRLKLVETEVPYAERMGSSKLDVFRDGWQFLKTILKISFTYKPPK